jgi:hypothetical protein
MEKKEITIYELLGILKNGKEPKKIKYDGYIWEFKKNMSDYWSNHNNVYLFDEYIRSSIISSIQDNIEILDENYYEFEDFEDIKELGYNFTFENINAELCNEDYKSSIISKKLNQLIRNQRKIVERLKDNG